MTNLSKLGKRLVEFGARRYPEEERQSYMDELHDHIDSYCDEGLSSRALWVGLAQLRPSDVLLRRECLLALGPLSLIVGPVLVGKLGEDSWPALVLAWTVVLGVFAGLVASVPFVVFFFSVVLRSISASGSRIADRWVRDVRILTWFMGAGVVFSAISVMVAMEHASWNAYLASDHVHIVDGGLPDSFSNGGWSGMGFVGVLGALAALGGLGWTIRSMGDFSSGGNSPGGAGPITPRWYGLEASLLVGLAVTLAVAGSVPLFAFGRISEMPGQPVVIPSVASAVAFLSLPIAVGLLCWLFATMRLVLVRRNIV